MTASDETGHQQNFDFVLRTSNSVRHSFNFVFDRICSVMASAEDNAAQLPAVPGFLTQPSRVVTRGAFLCIPCSEDPGRTVSRNELRKLVEHGRASHPIHNPAQPGRSTARNATSDEESGKQYFKFQLNFIGYHLLLRSTADCCPQNVEAPYATDQRSAMDTVEIVEDIMVQSRAMHAPSRIVLAIQTHWES
jgi:hypothetical protein